MDGIFPLYKEKGPTSFGAIEEFKRLNRLSKVGHAGTLDPLGEGLLIVLVNKGVKINRFMEYDKEYEITVSFGRATTTDDSEGDTLFEAPVPGNLDSRLQETLPLFTGEINQVPPVYSAIKKDGKKLYELAREGKEVVPEPRRVRINSIELLSCGSGSASLRVSCGSGTYMRSLARDLGEKLGTRAYMSSLKRTKIGRFSWENSYKLSGSYPLEGKVISIREALYEMNEIFLSEKEEKLVRNGAEINRPPEIPRDAYVKLVFNGEVSAIGLAGVNSIKVERGI